MTIVHLFSYRVNRGSRGCKTYAVCGAEAGQITHHEAQVTCPACKP